MNGLFRRLAADVSGAPAARLRAISRLPYAEPPSAELDAPVELASAPPPLASGARTAAKQASAGLGVPSVFEPTRAMSAEPAIVSPVARNAPAPMTKLEPAELERRSEASEPQPSSLNTRPAPAPPAFDEPRALQAAAPVLELSPLHSAPQDFRPPPLLVTSIDVAHAHGIAEPHRASPAAAAAPAPIVRGLRQTMQAQAPDEPNEVHVHIGRVEVTAIRDSAPQQRPARRGAEPLSLDRYLAKRGERRG